MRTIVTLQSVLAAAALTLLVGCEFFPDADDEFGEDGSSGTTGDGDGDTGDPLPPRAGFRVFPKYLLQGVPAVVTIDRDAMQYECPLDGAPEGGYVCDATAMPAGTVTITIERDGFDTAVRQPELMSEVIVPLDVHLSPGGGATGVWSGCVAAAAFLTCGDVCSNEMLGCAVASCATGQDQWPIATLATFGDAECVVGVENVTSTCADPLPIEPAVALRCCCAVP